MKNNCSPQSVLSFFLYFSMEKLWLYRSLYETQFSLLKREGQLRTKLTTHGIREISWRGGFPRKTSLCVRRLFERLSAKYCRHLVELSFEKHLFCRVRIFLLWFDHKFAGLRLNFDWIRDSSWSNVSDLQVQSHDRFALVRFSVYFHAIMVPSTVLFVHVFMLKCWYRQRPLVAF